MTFNAIAYGEYYIKETQPALGYYSSDTILYATISEDGEVIDAGIMTNEPMLGNIQIKKTAEDGSTPLSGATLGLYRTGHETPIITAVSDENGNVMFTDVVIGNYIIKEITAPDGYLLSDEEINVSLSEVGETIDAGMISNEPVLGNIQIKKTTEDGLTPLAGATLGLYRTGHETPIMTAVSDESGNILFADVSIGDYIIKEITAPDGYLLSDEEIAVSISEAGGTIDAGVISNKPVLGDIKIKKTTEDGLTPLAGATLGLYGIESDIPVMADVSDENGNIFFTDVPIGDYIIKETTAPDGYLLSDKEIAVSISATDTMIDAGVLINTIEPVDPDTPDTGDRIDKYYGFMLFALIGIFTILIAKKRLEQK